jgi:predicted DNA-binding mobile mystery protein A
MLQDLPLKHLDEQLAPWRELPYLRPRAGWLRAIREALGMTVRQFAKAAKAAPSTAQAAERAEAKGDISLSTLTRYADALGCELRYVLVPKRPLQQVVEQRAEAIARAEIAAVHHSMALEEQATGQEQVERQVAELRRKLLEGPRSRLWT